MKKFQNFILITILSIVLTGCSNLDIQILNQKAVEYMRDGDVDSAIARLESINDLNPNFPQTYYNLGIAYHKKEQYEKAIESLDKATELKKDFSQAYYTKGVIFEEMGLNILEENEEIKADRSKKKKTLDNKAKQKIFNYFSKSKENFENYIKYEPKAEDAKDIESKINQLQKDIEEYKPEQVDNSTNLKTKESKE